MKPNFDQIAAARLTGYRQWSGVTVMRAGGGTGVVDNFAEDSA